MKDISVLLSMKKKKPHTIPRKSFNTALLSLCSILYRETILMLLFPEMFLNKADTMTFFEQAGPVL